MKAMTKILALGALGALAVAYLRRPGAGQAEPFDHRLRDSIRATLRPLLSQPEAVEVVVNMGDVSLRGGVNADELDRVLSAVLAVPGVRHIHNRLAAHDVTA